MMARRDAETDCMTMPQEQRTRILLVEGECIVRAALQKLLETWPEYEVVGATGNFEDTVELLGRVDPDVILLTLPDDSDGLDMVRDLVRAAERAQILILLGASVSTLAVDVVKLGARGVVHKNKAPEELRRAIQKVHLGREIWLDRASLASLITVGLRREDSQKYFSALTRREREVVGLVSKGLKNKEVGEGLFISETTVRHHLTTIFGKLDVRNRFELIDYLHRHRFFALDEMARPGGHRKRQKQENKGEN
jgi:DNA-binding NarL/FixJ family response regulator